MAQYSLFMLKVPLNTSQPTNQPALCVRKRLTKPVTQSALLAEWLQFMLGQC